MIQNPQGFSLVETLIALFIVSVVTLGGSSLLIQTHRTSNKSKVVMQGLQLESDLIEAVSNKNSGWSQFASFLREGATPVLKLKRMMAPGLADDALLEIPPMGQALLPIYYDRDWRKVLASEPWTVRILLAYRKTFDPPGDKLPEYAIAYSIQFNTSGALPGMGAVRYLGQISTPEQFATADFVLPISTLAYSGDGGDYGNVDPGLCSADPREVIGVSEINFISGRAKCVTASADLTCAADQISVGTTLSETPDGNAVFGLNCKSKLKCSCRHIADRNWVVTSYAPNAMIYEAGPCGTCEFAYQNSVAGIGAGIAGPSTVTANICPRSENYTVLNSRCRATPQVERVSGLTAAQNAACDANPPSDTPRDDEMIAATLNAAGSGAATCTKPSGGNACFTWTYRLEFLPGATCELITSLRGARNADQIH